MHKSKWSKRLKTLISVGAVTTMLIPNIAQVSALTNENEKSKEIRNSYDNIHDKSNITVNKIDKNIDIESEKEVSVIVEFNSPALAQSQSLNQNKSTMQDNIQKEHKEFESFLNKSKKEKSLSEYKINHEYENVYNGVSISLKGSEVEALLESKVVKKIWNNNTVQLDLPKEDEVKSEVQPRMNDSVAHIGVDKLHNEGLKGKGVKVGVLDTGVDYNHPDLKDNFKGGYDFVDNDNDPMESTYKDWQESGNPEFSGSGSYYTSHGTHVSGTVLANAKSGGEGAVLGVAPEADLYGYRVLGPYGSGGTDGIVAALEQSIKDGMDVVNLSLGMDINDPNSPLSVACNNTTLAGVVTVIANGNAGPTIGTVGAPGAAALPISVGASSTSIQLETFKINTSAGSTLDGTLFAKDYKTSLEDFASNEYDVVDCGLGSKEDYENKDVKGKIALIQRGDFALNEKASNATEAGAAGVIIYNNVDGAINYYVGESTMYLPSIEIDKASGEKIVEELNNNSEYKINIDITGKVGTEGDKLADFSSRGPVIDGNIKPDIVAPGVNIRSTYPEYINHKEDGEDYSVAYSRISGTSMASPHIAGVAALLVQNNKNENKEYTPQDIKLAMMNTAEDLNGEYGVNEMGAGRVDAYEAAHPGIVITNNASDKSVDSNGEEVTLNHKTGSMSFGIAEKSDKNVKLSDELIIKNNTDKTKTFDVSVEYVSPSDSHGGLDAVKNGVKLDVKENATASKNKETKLGVNLIIPKDAEQGLYQGYINLVSRKDSNEKYQIPFSVKYLEGGINTAEISRNAMTSNPEMAHPWLLPGIAGVISVNSQIERMDFVIKDFETKKDIGYTTSYDGKLFMPGVEYSIRSVMSMNPSIYPINEDGVVEHTQIPLKDGKYIFEYRAIEKDGNVTSRELPLLIESDSATIKTEIKPGTYEITEKDFTQEVDGATGETYNAYWIKGEVDDNSIELLKQMGFNATRQHAKVSPIINGMPQVGFEFFVDENGKFKAGLTADDLNPGSTLGLVGMDIATNNPLAFPTFNIMREGTKYLSTDIDKEILELGDNFNLSVGLNNVEKISYFKTTMGCISGINPTKVELSKEFKESLDEKEYEANLSHKFNDNEGMSSLDIEIKVTDKDGNSQNIVMDGNIVNVEYKVEDEKYVNRGYIYIQPRIHSSEFKDNDGNPIEGISQLELTDRAKFNRKTSSADIINIIESTAFGFDIDSKKYTENDIWVEDNNSNKYPVKLSTETESYIVNDLPTSDEAYTIVVDAPGHFRKEGKFIPSVTQEGNIYGKFCVIGSGIFNGVALAGDTNKDGAIDIVDARNIADVYNQTEESKIKGKDLNYDGKVDKNDMDYVVQNFLQVNEQDKNAKKPEKTLNGKTLDDILKEIGYKK